MFVGFTLSQLGMVRHHLRLREPNWRRSLSINALGCVMTGAGRLGGHRVQVRPGGLDPGGRDPVDRGPAARPSTVTTRPWTSCWRPIPTEKVRRQTNTVVVLVGRVTKGSLMAIAYARSLNPDRLVAVSGGGQARRSRTASPGNGRSFGVPVELQTLYSPYRELSRPILRYIDELDDRHDDDFLTVILPEFALTALVAAAPAQPERPRCCEPGLRSRPNTVVTSVPFHVDSWFVRCWRQPDSG